MNDKDGAVTLGFALRAGTPMSYLAIEANADGSAATSGVPSADATKAPDTAG